mgnify:CR=1 FL=1
MALKTVSSWETKPICSVASPAAVKKANAAPSEYSSDLLSLSLSFASIGLTSPKQKLTEPQKMTLPLLLLGLESS